MRRDEDERSLLRQRADRSDRPLYDDAPVERAHVERRPQVPDRLHRGHQHSNERGKRARREPVHVRVEVACDIACVARREIAQAPGAVVLAHATERASQRSPLDERHDVVDAARLLSLGLEERGFAQDKARVGQRLAHARDDALDDRVAGAVEAEDGGPGAFLAGLCVCHPHHPLR